VTRISTAAYLDALEMPSISIDAYRLLDFMLENCIGTRNTMTATQLERALDVTRERTNARLRELIRELRHSGVPVISSSRGYYIATDRHDVRQCVASLRSRAQEIGRTADLLEATTDAVDRTPPPGGEQSEDVREMAGDEGHT